MLAVLPGFLLLACTTTAVSVIPDQDRVRITRELDGTRRWLKVSVNVGPFFGDGGKLLISDQPFAELELIETPDGKTIAPPAPERILPPGTAVTVRTVELPTPWLAASRVLLTPRHLPWLWLELPGEQRPLIAVLPASLSSFDDVKLELDRYLATYDTGPELQALPEGQRRAVQRKELMEGMGPGAVVMAWGYPERKVLDRPAGKEQWTWPGGKRKAWFEDERLVRFEGR